MKRTVIILNVFVFFNTIVLGQESALYNHDGKLFVDTTLSVDTKIIDELVTFEKYILPNIYNRISYPEICAETGISGLIIVKIKIQSDTTIVIEPIGNPDMLLLNAVEQAINYDFLKSDLKIWEVFKKYPVEFCIPVKFEALPNTFRQDLKENNAVLIKAFSGAAVYEKIGIKPVKRRKK